MAAGSGTGPSAGYRMKTEQRLAVYYVFVYIFCLQIITTNTRTSTLWKLNSEQGKIVSVPTGGAEGAGRDDTGYGEEALTARGDSAHPEELDEDEESTFSIITSTAANYHHNTWNRGEGTTEELLRRLAEEPAEAYLSAAKSSVKSANGSSNSDSNNSGSTATSGSQRSAPEAKIPAEDLLTCGKPVNFTHYDDLVGVAQRYEHNLAPEPEVAYLFLKRKAGGQSLEHFNVDALERRLRRAKKEQPHTIQLWNQIGNFWRIKGDAGHAIECFRRALSISPTNADTLLNLARVLFNLQYLDDAISLTKRSLEVHPPDRSAWRQYFTLGEIFKAYGQLSDSILHLKQALALHPHYEPIRRLIAETEKIEFASNTTRMQFYTGLIIVVLSLVVLMMVTVMLKSRSSNHGHCGGGVGGGGGGDGTNNNAVRGIVMDKDEKRMRREIANSNERRRMQSINAGFQSLRQMLPHHEGEKLSKAAILQQTAEYIYTLEQEKTQLLSQNCHLKRLVDQHDHNGAVAAAEMQKAAVQPVPGVTVLTATGTVATATAVVVNNGSTGAAVQAAAAAPQVATIAKKRKIDAIIQPVSDSSDEGLGSMSPEPVSLMQVVNNAAGTTLVTAVNGRPCPPFNVSAKDFLDLKHQLEIERRKKAVFEERLKALERQIYPARVLYQDHPELVETSGEPLVEEVIVPTIAKTVTTKIAREPDNVQLIALDITGVISKKQLVGCGPEIIEETVIPQPIAKPAIVAAAAAVAKEEKVFIKRSRSRSPTIETVVTLPPKKNRYPTILEAAIKAEPKVEVERIDSPSSIVVSDDHLTHLTSSKLVTSQQQQAASRINTCRHNLETIVEAIRHLEGDAFDNVAPAQHQQASAVVRPAVQEVPLALTTSSKQKEREHRQSQLEPYLTFRTPSSTGTCPPASSATSSSASSILPSSNNSSSNPSGNPAVVSVSITPTVALAAGGCSPSPLATSTSVAQHTASQILQQHQQCRPGVIVVKQTS